MFQTYFKTIQEQYLAGNESSELTYRTAFETFLRSFETEFTKRNLIIKHEPRTLEGVGRPDFKVMTQEQLTIGLIETKKIGENLEQHLNSEQLERYRQYSDNIIITDYLEFWLLKNGEIVCDSWLFREYNLEDKRHKIEKTRIEEMTALLVQFFESEPATITNSDELATKLAVKATFLREFCVAELMKDKYETSRLEGLYAAFQHSLLPLLDRKYFSDIYAQTLTYGLFLAALNCDDPRKQLTTIGAYSFMPGSLTLIRELFHSLDLFPAEIVWAIEEIITILKVTDYAAIKHEFADYRNKERGFNDPFIYFYEDFLKRYDKSQRELRGVYYTPEPVVQYIVRSIEYVIKVKFHIYNGFINPNVTLLDFATGTGTFLLNAFQLALEQATTVGDKGFINKLLNEQIIKNFYGFELLVAPYIVAHLKISEFLKERGFSLNQGNRLNIFLTNTLTKDQPEPFPTMPALSKEGREADRIKKQEILVILGNPPYSGHSANNEKKINNELKPYYVVDGVRLEEKNPKWLQDDYVKFIRFAQTKMDKIERGVVGIITNHSYIDNPTFRGMRQSLMASFDEIYILDLHGNTKKKEKAPDGSKDECVFEIQQGVAIALFIKHSSKPKSCKVFHADLYGKKEQKHAALFELLITNTDWTQIEPKSPFYFFKPRNEEHLGKYEEYWSVKEIFSINGVGITSAHDEFVIHKNKNILLERFKKFKSTQGNDIILHDKFNVRRKQGWDILKGWQNLQGESDLTKFIEKIIYRPFDNRYIFLEDKLVWRAVRRVNDNFIINNIGLILNRNSKFQGSYSSVFISENIIDGHCVDNIAYFFPLYSYTDSPETDANGNGFLFQDDGKRDNFTKEFRKFIKNKYKNSYSPEQILGYIYAVLHSPAYRAKYVDFLKFDFPRIPFTNDETIFAKLSAIGGELIEHHLLKSIYKKNICRMCGDGDNFNVEKVAYKKGKVHINADRYFDGIPEEIWNFHIGGYQVLDKWLKERKKAGEPLEADDIIHFVNIVNSLAFTIEAMKQIDELTKEWV